MDATQTQYIRLHKEWNPRRKGRGARFGRGGGHQSKVISQRAYVTEREKTLIAALIEAHKEEAPPTEYTATIAPGMCAKIDEPGVMDSGANVSVTNPLTVAKFNLTPQRWERPFHFIFGIGARFHCTHYAHFGPILGQVAIVEGAPDTLLSIAVLTARGYEVRFLPSGQGVGIYKDQKLLFHGPQHEQSPPMRRRGGSGRDTWPWPFCPCPLVSPGIGKCQ
jgi:hypothetical protein